MMDLKPKEVAYDKYCDKCAHKDKKDYEDPCNECMEQFWNEGTDKPIRFEEKDK